MTFETALAQSINIPALKTLYLVGVGNAVAFSKAFGLTTLGDQDQYGLTLVLGGGEVRLLDITSAFGVFANDGVRTPPVGILEVSDTEGVPLESYAPDPTQVIPDNIARDMSAMLSDNPARVPTYTINSPLYFPGYDVAVKTGTTNDTRDTWVIGYTPSIVIGTWAGNNNNTPMVKSIAGYIVVPMWHEVMEYALSKYPKSYFGEPTPIYSSVPPMLRGNWKIPDGNGQIIPHDLLHWVDKHNPTGPPPNDPQSDSQYAYWEYGVSMWFGSHPEALYTPLPPPPVPLSNPPQTTESLPQQSISL
jgi:membrane peptidoglycan carboxypeptidase